MSRPSSPPTRVPPRVIPANNEDKPVVDSMLVRMKKIEEYEDKIKNLLKMREKLITEIHLPL